MRRMKVETRLKQLNDEDNVIIVLYAYGMYFDDTFQGINNNRNYRTKKDIKENITNYDWYCGKIIKEEIQEIEGKNYLVIKASLID